MFQKLPAGGFKWKTKYAKISWRLYYDQDSDKGYILEVDVEYPKELHDLHSDLPFLSERMKISKSNKPVCNLFDKNNYVVHIRALKQTLNNELILKKVHKAIEFNQEAWLKGYIDMNTELRTQAKNDFEKKISLNQWILLLLEKDNRKCKKTTEILS